MNETVLDKFLRYAKIDTQSDEESQSYPSTAKQFDLLRLLEKELRELGVPDVRIDKYGYVMATLPSNLPAADKAHGKVPAIGFISHVDTSPSASGKDVKPQVMTYKGGDIVLPGDTAIVLRTVREPPARGERGQDHRHDRRNHAPRRRRQGRARHHHDGGADPDRDPVASRTATSRSASPPTKRSAPGRNTSTSRRSARSSPTPSTATRPAS